MAKPNFIDRPPRVQPELPHGQFDVPNPPNIQDNPLQMLLQMALPMVSILGYIIVSSFSKGRSMLMVIPMGIAVVASSAAGFYAFRKNKRDQKAKRDAYAQRLMELRHDMENDHEMQRTFYQYNYPEPETTLRIADDLNNAPTSRTEDSRSGSRLWERRSSDPDFAMMRLGIATVPSTVIYKLSSADNFDDPQMRDAIRLTEDSHYVPNASVVIPLRLAADERKKKVDDNEKAVYARHAIGVTGNSPEAVYAFMRGVLVDFAAFHSPNDVHIFIVGPHPARQNWRWAFSLPHCKGTLQSESINFEEEADKHTENESDRVALFWRNMRVTLERRKVRLVDDKNAGDEVILPHLVVVVDVLSPTPDWSSLHDLESNAAISLIMSEGPSLGVSILFLVPDRTKVPSPCNAVIEISDDTANPDEPVFRYAEVNLNSPRFVGRAGTIRNQDAARDFAKALEPLVVRRSYGADLATSVTLLEMLSMATVDDLTGQMSTIWARTRESKASDWLGVNVGVLSGNEIRRLVFSAKADGVHGIVAGSTGSGKSELLTTMILGLALTYDPSVVNLVLVDYKGGAAFEPFRNLPHTVDIVTNLEGSATARMFASIKAELDRRQRLNTYTDSKDIVHYRKKGLHLQEGSPPYPFLFIIIDEFAEMIAGNAEFKSQLESITRLGRALGVHLILAAQRPAGVTDQMRANIKFRICLRVETPDDSRELLRRSDAAFLPPGIPGRGYLQVGNENIELIQTAFSGGDYLGPQAAVSPNVVWLNRPKKSEKQKMAEPPKLQDVVVDRLADMYKADGRKVQWRPWPAFLPKLVSLQSNLDMAYMSDNDVVLLREEFEVGQNGDDTQAEQREAVPAGSTDGAGGLPSSDDKPAAAPEVRAKELPTVRFPLNAAVSRWMSGEGRWNGVDWSARAMRPIVGLVDNPYDARQLPLIVNFPVGHAVIFGASGWGKTTFLRSLMVSLMATHSPDELQIYILDFGGRNLIAFQDFPHVGAVITSDEEERVRRLIRKLTSILEFRQSKLSEVGATDIYAYNAKHPEAPYPAILVAIDNFAEFKENFDTLMLPLISLVRDARALGIHFVLTADLPNALSGKLFNLFTERMTLKLSDASEYSTVVGRGVPDVASTAGRGYVRVGKTPLEFQVAVPIGVDADDIAKGIDESEKIKRLALTMKTTWADGWKGERPSTIETLPIKVTLENTLAMIAGKGTGRRVMPALGLDDDTLEIYRMDLQRQGPHLIVIGPPNSGKTTTLRTIALSLASTYSAKDIMLVLIDFQRKFFDYGSQQGVNLGQLPHVVQTLNKAEQIEELTANLQYECKDLAVTPNRRRIFVLIDNYDSFSDEGYKKCRACFDALAIMLREYSTAGLHFIVAGSLSSISAQEDVRKQIVAASFGLALQSADAVSKLNGKIARSMAESEIPIGRGFIVKSGRTSMLQLATPYPSDDAIEASLDAWVKQIKAAHPEPQATWLRPPEPPKPPPDGTPAAPVPPPPLTILIPSPAPAAAMSPEQIADLKVNLKGRGYGEALLNALGPADLVRLAAKPKDGK